MRDITRTIRKTRCIRPGRLRSANAIPSNLTGAFHYTWGKGLSTGGGDIGGYYQGDTDLRTQDFFNPRADRGPSSGDIAHYFAAELIYDLPRLAGRNALLRYAAGGWQISGMLTAMSGHAAVDHAEFVACR